MKYLQKTFLFRDDAAQILLMSGLFSMALLATRMFYTGQPLFIFLVWNLFLAFVPFAISAWMEKNIQASRGWKFLLLSFFWLMFIPNSFYLITDLFHLDMNFGVPLWFDLALLLSFAWSGLLFGIVSVRQMERTFESYFNKKLGLVFILPVIALNGLGVYVGRYLRFNSWDMLFNPFQVIQEIINLFIDPFENRVDWSMIICYTMLLALIYYNIKKLGKLL